MYKYVTNYTEGYSTYNTNKVAEALEAQSKAEPEPEYDEKALTEYHCSLCEIRFKSYDRHIESLIHRKKQAKFVRRYYDSLKKMKSELNGEKGYFGVGKGIKKLRMFRHLYWFD